MRRWDIEDGEDGGGDGLSHRNILLAHWFGSDEVGHLLVYLMTCRVAMLRTDVRSIAPFLRRSRICVLHF